MENFPLPYRIERTRNRCSRATCNEETIVIRLAQGLSTVEEQEHIENLLKRVGKAFVRMRSKSLVDPFRTFLEREQTELHVTVSSGNAYRFIKTAGKRFRAEPTKDGWSLTVPDAMPERTLHRELWHLISMSEYHDIVALIDAMNQDSLVVTVRDVKLQFAESKWGSCWGNGTVMLNAALLFTPRETLHYVIAHELAHIEHPNHSARFWATVEKVMPDYEAAREELKGYRLPKL